MKLRPNLPALALAAILFSNLPLAAQDHIFKSSYFHLNDSNYFLFGVPGTGPKPLNYGEYGNQVKFRVSVRYNVVPFSNDGAGSGVYAAFNQHSFWHLYESSAPFFDNNYNPQFYFYFDGADVGGPEYGMQGFIDHESNGRDGGESRSWNRFGVTLYVGDYERSPVFGYFRFWEPFGVASENRDLPQYAGQGEVSVSWQPFIRQHYPLGAAGINLRSRIAGKGLIQNIELNGFLDPDALGLGKVTPSLMIQVFYGTGEDLLTYDEARFALRVGFSMLR